MIGKCFLVPPQLLAVTFELCHNGSTRNLVSEDEEIDALRQHLSLQKWL